MSIQPATHGQVHELHETANRIRRLVCDVFCNAQRIAMSGTQNEALEVNEHRLHELLEELARLDDQIADVPSVPSVDSGEEGEQAAVTQ